MSSQSLHKAGEKALQLGYNNDKQEFSEVNIFETKYSKYSMAVNLICIILLLGISIYLGVNWVNIPDKIPGHYNTMGAVDRWGNKGELLIFLVIGWIAFLGITTVGHFHQIWNTGVTITEENRERIYRIIRNLLNTIKLIIIAHFSFLIVNSALAKELPVWDLPVLVILLFGSLIFFIVKLVRAK